MDHDLGSVLHVVGYSESVWVAQLALQGDLDMATAPALMDVLLRSPRRHPVVVLDLSAVAFVDLVGLRALLAVREGLAPLGSELFLRSPPRGLRRMVSVLGLSPVLPVVELTGPPATSHWAGSAPSGTGWWN